jgi:hypothetical protein
LRRITSEIMSDEISETISSTEYLQRPIKSRYATFPPHRRHRVAAIADFEPPSSHTTTRKPRLPGQAQPYHTPHPMHTPLSFSRIFLILSRTDMIGVAGRGGAFWRSHSVWREASAYVCPHVLVDACEVW